MPSTYVDTKFNQAAFNLVWDVSTLRWVAMEQPILDGGDINVVGPVTVAGDVGTVDQFDLTNSNPLTVAIVDASGDQITTFGAAGGVTDAEMRAYQTATGTITAATQNVTLALNGASGASVNFIDSSFNGTFKFYASCDGGTTYVEVQAFNVYGATGGTEISNSFHASGILGFRIWNFVLVGGETHVRVQAETGNSGSTAVTIKANHGAPSPTALAIGSYDSDSGRPVGGLMLMGRLAPGATTGTRSLRLTSNRYEGIGSSALITLANNVTNNVSTITNTNDTTTSTQIAAQNIHRLHAFVTNTSSAVLFVLLENGGTASVTRFTKRLAQWETWEVSPYWIGQIQGIWASDPNDGVAIVTEI